MAREMNRGAEEARWLQSAESIRKLILDRLYDPLDGAFYDIDSHDKFVRVRGDLITRVMGEHVVDQKLFEEVWRAPVAQSGGVLAAISVPLDRRGRPVLRAADSAKLMGGASQALTALRTPRWMEHYGKQTEFVHLMTQWVSALVQSGEFLQQMDPDTGEFSPDRGAYSPAMLTLFDFTWRLYGVRPEGDTLQWNCRLPEGAASVTAVWGPAKLETDRNGSTLTLAGNASPTFAKRAA